MKYNKTASNHPDKTPKPQKTETNREGYTPEGNEMVQYLRSLDDADFQMTMDNMRPEEQDKYYKMLSTQVEF
jgi:hypothetical protein